MFVKYLKEGVKQGATLWHYFRKFFKAVPKQYILAKQQ